MEEIKRQRRRSMLILGAALLLIVTGTVLIKRVINLYSMMIQEDKDADHMDLTYSLDQNIAGYIERYSESLAYVVQRRGFQSAEDIWKSTGDTEELLFRLNENLLIQDELVTAMVSVYNNEIILSTDGRRDYFFRQMPDVRTKFLCARVFRGMDGFIWPLCLNRPAGFPMPR